MSSDRDHYEAYYAEKLWRLLPAVYRAEDTDRFDRPGPLRELVDRLGAQAAVVRRSIDRLWEDQSIETCDAWAIAYIADLLATRLVAFMDERGRRLDVARTIAYRRRKGTVGLLEELAADVTGWDARVVEFFRRLGRTRHLFDPPVGDDRGQLVAEGLIGPRTGTPAGGLADLRHAHGALQTQTAFDEFAHTADVRRGVGRTGWHNVPRLGVFLWRLRGFGVGPVTPVPVLGHPGHFTFDPTGRGVPLFARGRQGGADPFGAWVSPAEWQLPGPISRPIWDDTDARHGLYPDSLAVSHQTMAGDNLLAASDLVICPEQGRFRLADPAPAGPLHASYHYGFFSEIGAGPYDRRGLRPPGMPDVPPVRSYQAGEPLTGLPVAGTAEIGDSLTYEGAADVTGIAWLALRAGEGKRPLIRLSAPWAFSGLYFESELDLEGLFISGDDIVVRGMFSAVTLRGCTLDPGTAAPPGAPGPLARAVDGRDLVPCRLRIEGYVRRLVLERCVAGPIRVGAGGRVDALTITDSIVQAIDAGPALGLDETDATLSRCTVLGDVGVHRIDASESILAGAATVVDAQRGCVRFSAWVRGSVLPRQFESVRIAPGARLFAATDFGRPDYALLLPGADAAVGEPADGTILEGAEDGSEMGAFAREKAAIKRRGLLLKLEEFLPVGLIPVVIEVT
jgi:hypothetical protein